jgi:two-component system response regulator ArlR
MRILLAEDEKDLVNALCTILKHSNYSVDAVYNGANDYLTKPFAAKELLARIRAVTRNAAANEVFNNVLKYGNVTLDLTTYELASVEGSFMDKIWGFESEAESNVVWVNISYLRKKLKTIGADINIKATRNVGYSLEKLQSE